MPVLFPYICVSLPSILLIRGGGRPRATTNENGRSGFTFFVNMTSHKRRILDREAIHATPTAAENWDLCRPNGRK